MEAISILDLGLQCTAPLSVHSVVYILLNLHVIMMITLKLNTNLIRAHLYILELLYSVLPVYHN